jgi:hypothetical protein
MPSILRSIDENVIATSTNGKTLTALTTKNISVLQSVTGSRLYRVFQRCTGCQHGFHDSSCGWCVSV